MNKIDTVKAAIRPVLKGVVDPWTKDNFELWLDRLCTNVAKLAVEALEK